MAAIGDVFSDLGNSVADDGYLDAQPASDHEAIINNWNAGGDAEIYMYDGTYEILVSTITGGGCLQGIWRCTNSLYYRIKNINGDAQHLGYDGVYTKVT